MLSLVAFVSAALESPPVVAVEPVAHCERQNSASVLESARRVVAAIYTEDSQLAAADELMRKHQEPSIRSNAEFRRLDRLHPGFMNAVVARIRDGYRANAKRLLPEFRERMAALYAVRLSVAELDDLCGFYASETGRKLVSGMARHADSSAVIRERVYGEKASASATAVSLDQRSAASKTIADLKTNDFAALLALRDKPYFARLMALREPIAEVHREFASRPPAVVTLRADAIIAELNRKGKVVAR